MQRGVTNLAEDVRAFTSRHHSWVNVALLAAAFAVVSLVIAACGHGWLVGESESVIVELRGEVGLFSVYYYQHYGRGKGEKALQHSVGLGDLQEMACSQNGKHSGGTISQLFEDPCKVVTRLRWSGVASFVLCLLGSASIIFAMYDLRSAVKASDALGANYAAMLEETQSFRLSMPSQRIGRDFHGDSDLSQEMLSNSLTVGVAKSGMKAVSRSQWGVLGSLVCCVALAFMWIFILRSARDFLKHGSQNVYVPSGLFSGDINVRLGYSSISVFAVAALCVVVQFFLARAKKNELTWLMDPLPSPSRNATLAYFPPAPPAYMAAAYQPQYTHQAPQCGGNLQAYMPPFPAPPPGRP